MGFEHRVIFLALWTAREILDKFLTFLQHGEDLGGVSTRRPLRSLCALTIKPCITEQRRDWSLPKALAIKLRPYNVFLMSEILRLTGFFASCKLDSRCQHLNTIPCADTSGRVSWVKERGT